MGGGGETRLDAFAEIPRAPAEGVPDGFMGLGRDGASEELDVGGRVSRIRAERAGIIVADTARLARRLAELHKNTIAGSGAMPIGEAAGGGIDHQVATPIPPQIARAARYDVTAATDSIFEKAQVCSQ
jgi:hypothetical protein